MSQITQYPALTAPAAGDELPIVDISDSTQSPAGTTKNITVATLLAGVAGGGLLYPSGDPTGVTDATAVNALAATMTSGGQITLAPGTWYWAAGTIVITNPAVYIWGPGAACVVNVTGTGTGVRMYSASSYSPGGLLGGGLIGGFIIDGASAGNGSSGCHIGDIYQLSLDIRVRRFQGTGSIGAWIDNNYYWTEQITGKIWAEECTNGVVFDNSANTSGSATGSYDHTVLDIFLDCKNKGNGVTLQNGAFIIDGRLGIFGNTDQPSAQCAVLTLTGSNVANGYSLIAKSQLNIGMELNNISSGTQPYTIVFNSAGNNTITGCTGVLDFGANNPFAAAQNFGGGFEFDGPVYGDSKLMRTTGIGMAPYEYGALSNNQQLYTRYAGIVRVTTTTNVTGITLSIGSTAAQVAQTTTIINSGTGSITFAQSSSNLVGGAANVIAPNSAMTIIWNGDATLWYPVAAPAPATDLALAPSGANGETFPRQLAAAYFSSLTSEQPYASAIKLTAGIPVTNISLVVGGAAWTLADVTHGWYALTDSGLVVRGVTADETSGNWGSTFTTVTLALGTAYTPLYTGLFYIVFCATFTGSSGEFPALPAPLGGVAALTPILSGTSGSASSTTPPILGSTMTALSSSGASGDRFYAYTS